MTDEKRPDEFIQLLAALPHISRQITASYNTQTYRNRERTAKDLVNPAKLGIDATMEATTMLGKPSSSRQTSNIYTRLKPRRAVNCSKIRASLNLSLRSSGCVSLLCYLNRLAIVVSKHKATDNMTISNTYAAHIHNNGKSQ